MKLIKFLSKVIVTSVLMLLFAIMVVYLTSATMLVLNKARGVYTPDTELMICKEVSACIHELMHYMDDRLDFPSYNPKFLDTVRNKYTITPQSDLSEYGYYGYDEFYAMLFTYYYTRRDETPDELTPFYDWDIVDGLSTEPGFYWLGYYTIKQLLQPPL